jgi:hypothetical protein
MNEKNREISGERVNKMPFGEVVDKVGRTEALMVLSEEERRDLQERVSGMPFREVVYKVGVTEALQVLSKEHDVSGRSGGTGRRRIPEGAAHRSRRH